MPKFQSLNPYFRFIVICLLIAVVLILSACSTSGWFGPPRPEDLAKIYVELPPFQKTTLLPNQHRDAPLILAKAMQGQLREENRLQLDSSIHSLSIKNIILVHQSATLIAQAELFDDGELLQFSRVVRHLEANDDWMQAMEWVAELLLRELLEKLQQATLSSSRYVHYNAYYGNPGYPPFYRRHTNNPWLRPRKSTHPISSSALPNSPHQPQPKEHQASSAIVKALPKSHKTPRIAVQKPLDTAVDVSSDTGVIDIPRDSIYMPPVSHPTAGETVPPLEGESKPTGNASPKTSAADNPSTSQEASSVGGNTNNTLDTNSGGAGVDASPVQGEAASAGDPSPSSSESGSYASPDGSVSSSASESGSYSSPSESVSPSSSESGSYSSPSESTSPSSSESGSYSSPSSSESGSYSSPSESASPSSSESGSYSSPSESASPSSSESGSYSSPSESASPSSSESGSHTSASESVGSSSSGSSSESHQSASSSQQTSAPPTPEPSPPPPPPAPKPDPKPEPKTDNSTTEGSADTASP